MRRPFVRPPDGSHALHDRFAALVGAPLLEGDHGEMRLRKVEQFARAQQEVRPGRMTEALVAERERFVEQHAVVANGRQQMREERAMQVIGNDDCIDTEVNKYLLTVVLPSMNKACGELSHKAIIKIVAAP